ncbi:GerAB/ArcD/ProY family transporter [Clostridium oryzae]|uniref:Spore germination protein B2 n=1 Tax=Clostridium oryzae TaxID=1450648 RepID=A0A1V4ITN5_9CLOT|nr:endospore germination permease [Clostridium oryzae]OPJ63401.1 spore germination protein B2 [Clostridium oryzae]
MNKDKYIDSFGYFCTIIVTIVGIGIFSYPREVSDLVAGDSWLVALISAGITYLFVRFILKAMEKNEYKPINIVLRRNLGTIIGSFIMLLMALSNIVIISLGMRAFIEVIKMYLLQNTPTEFLVAITILCGVYLVRSGLIANIKFNEVAFWIMFIPMVFMLIFAAFQSDFTNNLPLFNSKPISYIRAILVSNFVYGGAEIIYLLVPNLKDKKGAVKTGFRALAFIGIFYAVTIILCIGVFTSDVMGNIIWPTITMMKVVDVPGTFVERWYGIVLALWIVFYFTTFSNGFTFSAHMLKDSIKLFDIRISSMLIVPFIYLIAMYPTNIAELYYVIDMVSPVFYAINLIFVPIVIFATGKIGRAKGVDR